jgi:hypothetical protein
MPPTDHSYSRRNTLSKLEAFEKSGINYKAEFRRNIEVLQDAINSFKLVYADCKELDLNSPAFEEKYFIKHRMKEILISITDDVARHCLYHDIKEEGEGNDSEKAFALSPPTRAAFFVKWIANFKPCKLDDYLYSHADKCSDMKKFENSNEILAIFVASTIMGLQNKTRKTRLISAFLTDLELKSFIYQLKYRISHQDALYGFFNRLYYSNPVSKDLNDDTGKI